MQHVCESVSNINAGVLKNNCFPDHAKSFLRFCSSRGVLVQSKMSCIGKNCLHGRWGLRISKEIRKSLEVCFVYGVKFIRRQTQTSFVESVYKYRGPCMSLLAVCTEHPADLHRSFYVISDCHGIQKNWALLLAPQSGAHSRGVFRDFHSIVWTIPNPTHL